MSDPLQSAYTAPEQAQPTVNPLRSVGVQQQQQQQQQAQSLNASNPNASQPFTPSHQHQRTPTSYASPLSPTPGASGGGVSGPNVASSPASAASSASSSSSSSSSATFDELAALMGIKGTSPSNATTSVGSVSNNSAQQVGLSASPSSSTSSNSQAGSGQTVTCPPNTTAAPVTPVANVTTPADNDYSYPVTSSGYDVYGEIGSGAFSTVYRAMVRDTGEEVAIKVIDLDQFNTSWDEIRREILIMSQLQHPNVVQLKTAFVDTQDLWIVMSLMHGGSCSNVMKELGWNNGIKDEVMIATILKEVLQALAYFHKHGSIHRDVKAGNILISANGEVQLADFGVAGTLMEGGDRKKSRSTFTGTPCWMAPEVMEHAENEGYDEKADIWSFGITAMELGYGRAPYARYPPMKVMLLTLQEEPPTAAIYRDNSYEFSKHFHSMIAKCLRRDPKKRPTVRKLLEHKFFQKAQGSAYLKQHLVDRLPKKDGWKREEFTMRHHRTVRGNVPGGGGDGAGAASSAAAVGGSGVVPVPSLPSGLVSPSPKLNPAHPGAGVRIGSWVFDDEELEQFKTEEGPQALDLLTGTLKHQHVLPHHHSNASADGGSGSGGAPPMDSLAEEDPQEEEDYIHPNAPTEDRPLTPLAQPYNQAQQQNPSASVDPLAGLDPAAAFQASSNPNGLSNVAAMTSASAAPMASSSTVPSATTTATQSSIQGKTRQFHVKEEVVTDPANHQYQPMHTSQSPHPTAFDLLTNHGATSGTNSSSASQQYMESMRSPAPVSVHSTPRLQAMPNPSVSASPSTATASSATSTGASSLDSLDPLSLDSRSMTPGSATLAYLAAASATSDSLNTPQQSAERERAGGSGSGSGSGSASMTSGDHPSASTGTGPSTSTPVLLPRGTSPRLTATRSPLGADGNTTAGTGSANTSPLSKPSPAALSKRTSASGSGGGVGGGGSGDALFSMLPAHTPVQMPRSRLLPVQPPKPQNVSTPSGNHAAIDDETERCPLTQAMLQQQQQRQSLSDGPTASADSSQQQQQQPPKPRQVGRFSVIRDTDHEADHGQ